MIYYLDLPQNETESGVLKSCGLVFHVSKRYLRWLLWVDKSGKLQCRENIMGFGAWHISFKTWPYPLFRCKFGQAAYESKFSNSQDLDTSYALGCGKVQYA